jgi:hypothetical protein
MQMVMMQTALRAVACSQTAIHGLTRRDPPVQLALARTAGAGRVVRAQFKRRGVHPVPLLFQRSDTCADTWVQMAPKVTATRSAAHSPARSTRPPASTAVRRAGKTMGHKPMPTGQRPRPPTLSHIVAIRLAAASQTERRARMATRCEALPIIVPV